MRKWKRCVPAAVLMLAAMAAVMLTFTVRAEESDDGRIPERVYFGTISGGGLTEDEAIEEIEAYVDQLKDTAVTLRAGQNTLQTTAGELGLYWSNPEIVEEAADLGKSGNLIVRYKAMKDLEHEDKVYTIGFAVDAEKVTGVLEAGLKTLNKDAVNTGLKREGKEFIVVPGVQGVSVKVQESAAAIEEYFTTLWNETDTEIDLVAEIVEPKGTAEELSKVKDVLGTYNTSFKGSAAGRVANVTNGANKINGSVVYPGDQFSVYEMTSPYTPENGYELAGAYENGQTVESYGGGMCQVSTTLYNAAIRAELEITERAAHSMTVSYVDPSADAAIAGTYKDLKFVNNTDAPIYIEGYTSGTVIYFTIYGHETRDKNRQVSFVSEIIESTDPGTEFKKVSEPVGVVRKKQGIHMGIKAQLWKIVTVDGEEVSREVFNKSTYNPSKAIYEIGVSSSNPAAVAAINAAIATNDLAAIKAAAAAWSDEALAAQQPAAPEDPNAGTGEPNGGSTDPNGGGEH